MGQNEIDEIEGLLNQVMSAQTKVAARHPLSVLKFKKSAIRERYGNNASYKFSEVINSAESAAGRVAGESYHQTEHKCTGLLFKVLCQPAFENGTYAAKNA